MIIIISEGYSFVLLEKYTPFVYILFPIYLIFVVNILIEINFIIEIDFLLI